jgi:hypothetical protein
MHAPRPQFNTCGLALSASPIDTITIDPKLRIERTHRYVSGIICNLCVGKLIWSPYSHLRPTGFQSKLFSRMLLAWTSVTLVTSLP